MNIWGSKKALAALERVEARIKGGELPVILSQALIELPPDAPARGWTTRNQIMAAATTGHGDARGYQQWAALGRKVTRPGGRIFVPQYRKVEEEDGTTRKVLVAFKLVAVHGFDATIPDPDFEGEPFNPDYKPKEMPPLMEIAERLGVSVEWAPTGPIRAGFYTPAAKRIVLGDYDHATYFHELGHALQDKLGLLVGASKLEKEAEAELFATVISSLYGVDREGSCWEYVSQYAKEPTKAIERATANVARMIDWIEGKEEKSYD